MQFRYIEPVRELFLRLSIRIEGEFDKEEGNIPEKLSESALKRRSFVKLSGHETVNGYDTNSAQKIKNINMEDNNALAGFKHDSNEQEDRFEGKYQPRTKESTSPIT